LDAAISLVKQHGLRRKKVSWPSREAQVFKLGSAATTLEEANLAIMFLLGEAADPGHSMILSASEWKGAWSVHPTVVAGSFLTSELSTAPLACSKYSPTPASTPRETVSMSRKSIGCSTQHFPIPAADGLSISGKMAEAIRFRWLKQ
jgi:hypothetical protein